VGAVIGRDDERDIVFLEVPDIADRPAMPLATARAASGARLLAEGFPGKRMTLSAWVQDDDGATVTLWLASGPGMSGAGLLGTDALYGMVISYLRGSLIAYAVSAATLGPARDKAGRLATALPDAVSELVSRSPGISPAAVIDMLNGDYELAEWRARDLIDAAGGTHEDAQAEGVAGAEGRTMTTSSSHSAAVKDGSNRQTSLALVDAEVGGGSAPAGRSAGKLPTQAVPGVTDAGRAAGRRVRPGAARRGHPAGRVYLPAGDHRHRWPDGGVSGVVPVLLAGPAVPHWLLDAFPAVVGGAVLVGAVALPVVGLARAAAVARLTVLHREVQDLLDRIDEDLGRVLRGGAPGDVVEVARALDAAEAAMGGSAMRFAPRARLAGELAEVRLGQARLRAVRTAHLFLQEAGKAWPIGPVPIGAAAAIAAVDALPALPQWGEQLRARVEQARSRYRPVPPTVAVRRRDAGRTGPQERAAEAPQRPATASAPVPSRRRVWWFLAATAVTTVAVVVLLIASGGAARAAPAERAPPAGPGAVHAAGAQAGHLAAQGDVLVVAGVALVVAVIGYLLGLVTAGRPVWVHAEPQRVLREELPGSPSPGSPAVSEPSVAHPTGAWRGAVAWARALLDSHRST
jgi:hypothetical protein